MNVLSNHPRWIFKKNSIGFFVGLDYYLYYSYSGCTTISPWSYVFPEYSMITWSCYMIWLPKFPCCLYLDPFIWLSTWIYRNLFPFWGSHNNSPVWNWFRRLEDKVSKVEKEDHMITTKEWRLLKGTCKYLRSVDLLEPMTRVLQIY